MVLLVGVIGCHPEPITSELEVQQLREQIREQETQIAKQEAQITEQGVKATKQEAQILEQERQLDGLKMEYEAQIAEREVRIAEITAQLSELGNLAANQAVQTEELEALIAQLEQEKIELEAEIEYLRVPEPQLDVPWVVGTITIEETRELLRKFFPKSSRKTSAYTSGLRQLVGLETLENFLAVDKTDVFPHHLERSYDVSDQLAFQLKEHWIEAGIPPWSFGLIKGERMTSFGKVWCWRNIFLTIENGEYVFHEIIPHTDEIIKIEEPYLEPHRVIISDRL